MGGKKPFFKWLNTRNRLSFRDGHNDKELWYMYLSPLNIFTGAVAVVLILFIVIITLVAYTPILDFIPGYPGNRSREILIANIQRLDSMERQLQNFQIYSDNLTLILNGKVPTTRGAVQQADTSALSRGRVIAPSRDDSLLRRKVEAGALAVQSVHPQSNKISSLGIDLLSPVNGVVTTRFNPRSGRFGVGIATASKQQVVAVAAGTVLLSMWTPGDGYIIQLQHSNNLVSVYRHCAESLKAVGERVKAGEVISYTGDGTSGEGGKGLFQFELWFNGAPIDPESYILFR